MHFVNVFSTKVRLLLETGPPFYVVIRATRSSSCLQDKVTVVPSFLSYFKTLSVGPANSRSAVKRSTDWADPVGVKIPRVATCCSTKYLATYSAFCQAQIKSFRFWDEDDYDYEIFFFWVLLTREVASFWRENVIAVVILLPVLARMS